MSDSDMVVKIKTHKESKIETIENSLMKLAEDNRDYFTNLKAIVLHAGAGNISDTDTPQSVVNGLKDAAETVHNVNSEARILISSILPRRNDRRTNGVISETNQALKDVCRERNYVFIDIDKMFLKDGNIKSEMRSFKSNENIHKKEGGSYYVVSANKASSVTL